MAIVIAINFFLLHLVPGDLVDVLAGQAIMDAEQMQALRERYGLDQPLLVQLGHYVWNLARLDLGYSPWLATPVRDVIVQRLPVTALLVGASVVLAVVTGTVIGVAAARRYRSATDFILSIVVLLFYATPAFLVGLILVLILSVQLQWLPIAGLVTPGAGHVGLALVMDAIWHLIMPVVALSLFYVAIYGRLARSSMLEVLQEDYVRTALAKGLTQRRVVYVHALRNALLPLVTMAGLQVSSMLGGVVLIETVFGLLGLGRTAFDAVLQRDANLLLGVLLVSSFAVVCVNLVVDLLYVWLDPRIDLR